MDVVLQVSWSLVLQTLSAVWEYLGDYKIFFGIPLAACLIGYLRSGDKKMKVKIGHAFIDAVGASLLFFGVVFVWKFCEEARLFWNPVMDTSARQIVIRFPDLYASMGSRSAANGLRERTGNLARELIEFSDQRLGNLAKLKVQLQASSYADALAGTSNRLILRKRLDAWNIQSDEQFQSLYWNRVEDVLADLANAKVDVSPVSRAAAIPQTGVKAMAVGLQLSVLADQIGKKPPFPQQVTPIEWQVILKNGGGSSIRVYADIKDRDSVATANGLLKELKNQHKEFDNRIYPLDRTKRTLSGVWILLPSIASTEQSSLPLILNLCQLEGGVNAWQVYMGPGELPATKIEIWPCDSGCRESFVLQHRGFN